ncbi:MAG: AAA family ATPase [Shewanella sp.]
MKIKKVEIEAFRAYKSKTDGTFDFTNEGDEPSNFVAIYAPNDFGKSSFYDAVEWAVTNQLERLGGDYNKANYENAARVTKDPNEGQKILRNKDVGNNIKTKVVVSTTRQEPFERVLPKIRSNGRDLSFGDRNQRINAFFRRVILSQDEIDRFLREAKPQERYSKFMESFGGDIEIARKELSVLISDNEAELIVLEKQHKSIIEELLLPIDLSVFERFNSVASELNAAGENIVLPDGSFSNQSEHQLKASLVSRQHELNSLHQAHTKISEALLERLAKIPEIELHYIRLAEQSIQLTRLQQGVADADKYLDLLNSYEKCVVDQKQVHSTLTSLTEVAENIDDFLKAEAQLLELSSRQKVLTEERSKSCIQHADLEQKHNELNDELKAADDRALLLRTALDNAGSIYQELSIHRDKISVMGKLVSDKEVAIQIDTKLREGLDRELRELSTLKITSNLLMAGNVASLLFDQGKIEQLTRCQADLDLIDVHNQAIYATQRALAEQMDLHERLIAIGLDYLSIQPSHVCPLCTLPHQSADALLNKVKGQNLISELSQENSQKLALSSIRQKDLRATIETITQQAIEAQALQVNSLHKKLNEINERLTKLGIDKSTLEAERKTLETRVDVLDNSVWTLSHEELISRVEAELKELSIKCTNLIERRVNVSAQITLLAESAKARDSELKALSAEIERKCTEYAYVKVKAYIKEKSLAASDLKTHCDVKKRELDSEALKYKSMCEFLTAECNDLQQKMTADGLWIDFSQLKQQKENLELNLTSTQSVIKAFHESLSNLIVVHQNDKLEDIRLRISDAIESYRISEQESERRLNSIKLLLELITSFTPYLKHLSLQEELVTLELLLEQRRRAHSALKAEMSMIVCNLKTLIDDFFYEDLINSIYRKIDPHPAFKKVEFKVDFDSFDKPGLNIVVSDEKGGMVSPILYFSAAQTNILSLSVFLANALHAKDDEGKPVDVILIDDPIQSMDSINILSTIDLLRSICLQFDKQVIISTHDENFFGLLQRKIPAQILGAKFLQLERFGVVVPVEPFLN